jgi:hypothetical protein
LRLVIFHLFHVTSFLYPHRRQNRQA